MNNDLLPLQQVYIVVDKSYGERLAALPSGEPVWVVKSAFNTPVARWLWSERCTADHHTGVTIFEPSSSGTPEEDLLSILEDVDLHHGEYSADAPDSEWKIIGCLPTSRLRSALDKMGFGKVESRPEGFTAYRS